MYSPEEKQRIIDHVCAQISMKRPLSKVLAEDADMPHPSTFALWRLESEEITDKVARARDQGMEAHLEEMIEIADDRKSDPDASSRKVRIYAREKAAQMLSPKRFGAKLDVTSDNKALVPTVTLVDNRVQSLLSIAMERNASKQELLDD